MKVSYNWIKKYAALPENLTMEQLGYDLTMRTVEVENIVDLSQKYRNIVVGKIKEIAPHPNADKLRVVQVEVGRQAPIQIVCGGSNLYEGEFVAVTLPGSYATWHGEGEPVEIKETQLRGVSSFGMIAGADEIGLSIVFPKKSESEILDLTSCGRELVPGMPIADLLDLHDSIIEIDNKSLTNRPDLWGHYGIARELAAIYQTELYPLPELPDLGELPSYPVTISIPERCHRFSAISYDNIDARKSPLSLQIALMKVDVRPINAIVDITNYVMLAVGQPSHAYDREHIKGGIIVRKAEEKEKLQLLGGEDLELSSADLVVADEEKALGLGGIMGGSHDSILAKTEGVLLEAASFEASYIRKTAQKFGVRTEASMRFEKGVDTQRVDQALGLAHEMIQAIYPEAKAVAYQNVDPTPTDPQEISVSLDWLSHRLGISIDFSKVTALLSPLGFSVCQKTEDEMLVSVPSWRSTGDVSLPDDILEEVARMIGYENFHLVAPVVKLDQAINQKEKKLERRVREYLAFSCGFYEIFTYPWMKDAFIKASGLETTQMLSLFQPPAPDQKYIRNSLIPGMLDTVVKNVRYFDDFRIFEMTQVFQKGAYSPSTQEEILPIQTKELTGAIVGFSAETIFYQAKGVLENMGLLCQFENLRFLQEAKPKWADRKAWLNIVYQGRLIGSLGLLSNQAKALSGLKHHQVCLFTLNMDALQAYDSRTNQYERLPLYPHVMQDLSILVEETTTWEQIEKAVSSHVVSVRFVDEYRGRQIPEGKKSVTLRIEMGSDEKTLTNEDISEKLHSVLQALQGVGATVREA